MSPHVEAAADVVVVVVAVVADVVVVEAAADVVVVVVVAAARSVIIIIVKFFPSKGNAKQFLFCSRSFPPLWPPYLLHLTMVNDFQQRQGLPDCQLPPTAGCCCLLNNLPSEEIFVLLFCLFFQRQRGQTE